MFEIFGIAGIAISVAAYVPQVVHLWREHCSEGISTRAWAMWLTSGVLIGLLAMHRGDPVFILLQVCSLTCAGIILLLSRRYRGIVCESHAYPVLGRLPTVNDLSPPFLPRRSRFDLSEGPVGATNTAMSASSTENRVRETGDEGRGAARSSTYMTDDELIDEAGMESFPAGDAPSFWARDVRPGSQAHELSSSPPGEDLRRRAIDHG